MDRAYLGLGSNLGDREDHLRFAVREPARVGSVRACSPLIETEPVNCPGGGMFLNACVGLDVELSPRELLAEALRIEGDRGRTRTSCNEPRVLDIDLLLFGESVVREQGLVIPHARMHERRFVLEPLVQIAPKVVHPVLQLAVWELAEVLANNEPRQASDARSGQRSQPPR